jgi:hypothetical protein
MKYMYFACVVCPLCLDYLSKCHDYSWLFGRL